MIFMTAYFKKQMDKESNRRIAADISAYGKEVIDSELFRKAFAQKHHTNTTVGEHTLNVTAAALRMCYALEKTGLRLDKRAVTIGALCHDLGIIGRYEKFENNRICCRLLPIDSVRISRKLVPEIDHKTEEIIRCHMWPLNGWMPTSAEGYLITVADKYSSIRELLYRPALPLLRHETAGMILGALVCGAVG